MCFMVEMAGSGHMMPNFLIFIHVFLGKIANWGAIAMVVAGSCMPSLNCIVYISI
jgi:hypothetical protein